MLPMIIKWDSAIRRSMVSSAILKNKFILVQLPWVIATLVQYLKYGFLLFSISVYANEIAAPPPNVLLILSDDMNTRLGTYGDSLAKTPNLDALAEQGVRFDRAYAQYPQCTQSRSSFLTGLYPDQTGVIGKSGLNTHFRNTIPRVKTLPQVFQAYGYHTARVGKVFHQGVPKSIGTDSLDDIASWDERHNPTGIDRIRAADIQYLGPLDTPENRAHNMHGGYLSFMRIGGAASDHTDGKVTDRAIGILEERQAEIGDKPFFLAVGYVRPHVPFAAPERFFDMHSLDSMPIVDDPTTDREDIPIVQLADKPYQLDMSDDEKRLMVHGYYASVSFVDDQVGRLLLKLDELSLTESTLIVFASDHGFLLGEHGLWQKSMLFEEALRIPLIFSVPGTKYAGSTVDSFVELVDIYPTILDLAGIDIPKHSSGQSFASLFEHPKTNIRKSALSLSHTQAAQVGRPGLQLQEVVGYSIKTERFRYTEWSGGIHGGELYDHDSDPRELTNLYADEAYLGAKADLKVLLEQRMYESKESRAGLQAEN